MGVLDAITAVDSETQPTTVERIKSAILDKTENG